MYDGDDFDVIEKDHVDMRRVLRGKGKSRGDFKTADSLLNDKTDFRTEAMKEKFAKMSIVTDIVTVPSSSATGLATNTVFRFSLFFKQRHNRIQRGTKTSSVVEDSKFSVCEETDGRKLC